MGPRDIRASLLSGNELYRVVVQEHLCRAKESVCISTANLKEMQIESDGSFRSILEVFSDLVARGVELRILHAELPSRPFRAAFERREKIWKRLMMKHCPRVHFKAVLVDGAWAYVGSANATGAGLGAKSEHRRNFELGFVTEDFEVIDKITALFESIWSGAECCQCKLRSICPDPIGPALLRTRKRRDGIILGQSRRLRIR